MAGTKVMSSSTKFSSRIKHSNNTKKSNKTLTVINLKIVPYILFYLEERFYPHKMEISTATVSFFLRKFGHLYF